MTVIEIARLKVGDEVLSGAFRGEVTCVDLMDDDKIVVKWDCAESEDVISDSSPLWSHVVRS